MHKPSFFTRLIGMANKCNQCQLPAYHLVFFVHYFRISSFFIWSKFIISQKYFLNQINNLIGNGQVTELLPHLILNRLIAVLVLFFFRSLFFTQTLQKILKFQNRLSCLTSVLGQLSEIMLFGWRNAIAIPGREIKHFSNDLAEKNSSPMNQCC